MKTHGNKAVDRGKGEGRPKGGLLFVNMGSKTDVQAMVSIK